MCHHHFKQRYPAAIQAIAGIFLFLVQAEKSSCGVPQTTEPLMCKIKDH